jgi:hypothetical protein
MSVFSVNDNETAESKGQLLSLFILRRRAYGEVKQKPGRSVRARSRFSKRD